MIAPRTLFKAALLGSLILAAGCGSNPPLEDEAETTKTDPAAKDAPAPPPTLPAAAPEKEKEAPKG